MLTAEEIAMFKQQLEDRKSKIIKNFQKANEKLNMMRNQEPKDEGDFAVLSMQTDIDSRILEAQREELNEIEVALDKIKNGTYGICEMCEEPIGIERLKVKNFARFCIACREINEKEQNN